LHGVSLAELADDALLTEYETAALLRISTNTLEKWRRSHSHPLEWELIGGSGRLIRYRAGKVKAFVLSGTVRGRARVRKTKQTDLHPAE
jgi:hypothetical protein